MKHTYLILIFLGVITISLSGCRDNLEFCPDPTNPECPDYDPCTRILPADARFMIFDTIYTWQADSAIAIAQDTGLLPVTIKHFRTFQRRSDTRYEWKVGRDPRTFTEPELKLDFSWQEEGMIEIRLVAEVEYDPRNCLAQDEMRDTTFQYLSLVEWPREQLLPIYGTYYGQSNEFPDSLFTTTLLWEDRDPFQGGNFLYGMSRGCENKPQEVQLHLGYDWFVTDQLPGNRCRGFLAIGKLNDADHREIKIDYWYDDDQGRRRHYVFTGWRQ